jgi:hypothetical protein
MYFCGVVCTYHSLWGKKLWTIIYLCLHAASPTKSFILLLSSGSIVCVSARICSRWQGEHQAWKEENWMHDFEGLNCLEKALLSKILHCSKCPICVPSFTRQTRHLAVFSKGFQPRNRPIYRRVTQKWSCIHKNQNIVVRVRLSCMPSLYMSYLLLGKLGTRQYFQKVSTREIMQSREEWHSSE